jgi:hypothetical protein
MHHLPDLSTTIPQPTERQRIGMKEAAWDRVSWNTQSGFRMLTQKAHQRCGPQESLMIWNIVQNKSHYAND